MTFNLDLKAMWKTFNLSQQSSMNFILILATCLCSWRSCWAKPKGDVCMLNGLQYQVGETWHPKLSPVEVNCINCSCLEGGDVKCTGVDCAKPDCEDPKYVPGECCPICEVDEEVVHPDLLALPGCEHDGHHYEEMEQFPSNTTAIKPLHSNQCVLCACYKGKPLCHLKTCQPQPGCLKTVVVSDDCCQQCEEYPEDDKKAVVQKPIKPVKPGDCAWVHGPQKNGSTWRPVVLPYGKDPFVLCKCLNGKVDCRRMRCTKAQLKEGCPKGRDRRGRKKNERKKKKNNSKNCKKDGQKKKKKGKKRKRCKSKRKNKKKSSKSPQGKKTDSAKTVFPADMKMDLAKPKLCVHKKSDYFVYFIKEASVYSLVLDVVKADSMEKIVWLIHKGRISAPKSTVVLQTDPLRHEIDLRKHLIGSATKRNIKKFFKRLDRKQQKCKKKCRRKLLEKSVKKLKLKAVNLRKSC